MSRWIRGGVNAACHPASPGKNSGVGEARSELGIQGARTALIRCRGTWAGFRARAPNVDTAGPMPAQCYAKPATSGRWDGQQWTREKNAHQRTGES